MPLTIRSAQYLPLARRGAAEMEIRRGCRRSTSLGEITSFADLNHVWYLSFLCYIYIIIYIIIYIFAHIVRSQCLTQGWCTFRMNASGSLGSSQTIAVATKRWLINMARFWAADSIQNTGHQALVGAVQPWNMSLNRICGHWITWSKDKNIITAETGGLLRAMLPPQFEEVPAILMRRWMENDGNILPSQWLSKKCMIFVFIIALISPAVTLQMRLVRKKKSRESLRRVSETEMIGKSALKCGL